MKFINNMNKHTGLFLGICFLAVTACGNNDGKNSNAGFNIPPEEEQQPAKYQVTLRPVNANVAGLVNGTGELTLDRDIFIVRVILNDAPDAVHEQHVHFGTTCPEPNIDINDDGFIDGFEAQLISGKILIPLDNDLRSQAAGGEYFSGTNYNYYQSTSFLAMLADLKIPDDITANAVTKLGTAENLDLVGKVVMIHGVPDSTSLPETVQGVDGRSPHLTLPIACGVITTEQEENEETPTPEELR